MDPQKLQKQLNRLSQQVNDIGGAFDSLAIRLAVTEMVLAKLLETTSADTRRDLRQELLALESVAEMVGLDPGEFQHYARASIDRLLPG